MLGVPELSLNCLKCWVSLNCPRAIPSLHPKTVPCRIPEIPATLHPNLGNSVSFSHLIAWSSGGFPSFL